MKIELDANGLLQLGLASKDNGKSRFLSVNAHAGLDEEDLV